MMKSVEFKRGYDAGYKQALLDALANRDASISALGECHTRRKMGGPDSPFKPRGIPGSIHNGT